MYSMHKMQAIATEGVGWSLCLLVTFVSPANSWTDRDAVWLGWAQGTTY